ncbi:hypothetical protein ABID41_000576 [Phenylobacterium koreense]|uniref:Uncharacterized protein n=1 Tax=Phenylobacterium koreense TaxID=266125 RepID=A0ABV2EEM5_9CAUL
MPLELSRVSLLDNRHLGEIRDTVKAEANSVLAVPNVG